MLKFYYSGAPNPTKVALFLEETGLPYEAIPVDTRKGEQHKSEFLAINPNGALPVLVDGSLTLSESNAILQYTADVAEAYTAVQVVAQGAPAQVLLDR